MPFCPLDTPPETISAIIDLTGFVLDEPDRLVEALLVADEGFGQVAVRPKGTNLGSLFRKAMDKKP